MVSYSFRPRFVDPIKLGLTPGPPLPGAKRQTIRAIGLRSHANPGQLLQLYTGMRTKYCRLIGEAVCLMTRHVRIQFASPNEPDRVVIGDLGIREEGALDVFARADGFDSWSELRGFWALEHRGVTRFAGVLITWEPKTSEPFR